MTHVDRIEGASEQTDAAASRAGQGRQDAQTQSRATRKSSYSRASGVPGSGRQS